MKISEITSFLENAFDILNEKYFDNELPKIVVTVQSSPRGVLGHFTPWNSWKEEDIGYKEINISAENLDRPIENVIATLIHEMVHFYCNINGIKDTSRNGYYHNSKGFKVQAEKRGLIIGYDKKIGHSPTTPSPELIEFIKEQGWSDIDLSRNSEDLLSFGGGSGRTTKPSSTRKYICPCCHNSVRATKFVNIACLDCDEVMVIEEK